MNKKKIIFMLTLAITVIGGLVFNHNFKNKKEIVYINAKTDVYDTLDELEGASKIIVIGKKLDETDVRIHYSQIDSSVVLAGCTVSDFMITKVIKNENANTKVANEKIISVAENSFYSNYTNKLYTIDGYKNMENGKEYILFIKDEIDGLFVIRGVNIVKVDVNKTLVESNYSMKSYSTYEINKMDKIQDAAKDKYLD
jgi:hypothetical protein